MAKKLKVKIKPREIVTDEELRRWCIEQAVRWPTVGGGFGGASSAYQGYSDVDLLGRAEKILAWVKKAA